MAALGTRNLTLTIGGTEYAAQVFDATVEADAADSDDVTYAEAASGGGRQYNLKIVLTQDMATSTLWTMIFDDAGDDVAVLLRPYGNASASASQPHFTMTANIREPDGTFIGGTADISPSARQQVEVLWPLTTKPTRVTA
jgi:hypothetical protein